MEEVTEVVLQASQMDELLSAIYALQNLVNALGYALMACAGMMMFAFLSYGFWRYIFGRGDK